jgi:hypothetical protein
MINRPPGSWITDTEGNITGPNLADEVMAAKFGTKARGPQKQAPESAGRETATEDEGRE